MTGTNHYLAGVAVATALKNPILVFPIAFASHFVLDVLPHFGLKTWKARKRWQLRVAFIDVPVLIFAIFLTARHHPGWYIAAGLIAFLPDTAWIYRFIFKEKFGKLPPPPANAFNTWHYKIQKLERWWGGFIEIGFALVLFTRLFD